jgi:hypothetical protein
MTILQLPLPSFLTFCCNTKKAFNIYDLKLRKPLNCIEIHFYIQHGIQKITVLNETFI